MTCSLGRTQGDSRDGTLQLGLGGSGRVFQANKGGKERIPRERKACGGRKREEDLSECSLFREENKLCIWHVK